MAPRALRQPVIRGARFFLAHAPGLVRHGSKPSRDIAVAAGVEESIRAALRPWEAARDYAPNQVLLGARHPDSLWDLPRPWFETSPPGDRRGPHGEIAPEEELYGLLKIGDQFDLVQLEADFVEEARGALATHPLIAKSDLEALGAGLPEAAIDARLGGARVRGAAPSALGAADRVHRGGARGGSDARSRRASREPRGQGNGGHGAACTPGGRGHRPRVRRLRDRQRRGSGGRSLSARGRKPGEGGGRAGRLHERDRRGRQGLLLRGPSTRSRSREASSPRACSRAWR
jgi:hypothetical protein